MVWDSSADQLAVVLGSISIVLSFPVLLSTALFPLCRSYSRQLVFFLTLANFGQGFVFVLQHLSPYPLCLAQSLFALFVDNSSFLWTLSITIYIWRGLQSTDSTHENAQLIKYFHVICWIIPLCISGIVGFYSSSIISPSNSSPWCSIDSSHSTFMWLSIYAPLFITYCLTLFFYFLAHQSLRSLADSESTLPVHPSNIQWEITDLRSKLLFIPLSFLLLRSFDLLYRILTLFHSPYANATWIIRLTSITNPSQGSIMGLIFVFFTRRVRQQFIERIKQMKILSCLRENQQENFIQSKNRNRIGDGESFQNMSVESYQAVFGSTHSDSFSSLFHPAQQALLYDAMIDSCPSSPNLSLSRRMSPILINQDIPSHPQSRTRSSAASPLSSPPSMSASSGRLSAVPTSSLDRQISNTITGSRLSNAVAQSQGRSPMSPTK
jgi:hypothetical protein